MASTYLGRRGYSVYKECLSIEEQQLIRKELKVTPFVPKSSIVKPTPFTIYRESSKKLYLPRFYGMNTYGQPDAIQIGAGEEIALSFKGELRPYQLPAVNAYLKCAKKEGCGLLELYCGAGKTVSALYIITKIGLKTLIIVHKTFLMNQWAERIREFIPGARIGRIQGDIIDIDGKDIVLAMLQSLSMKEYPSSVFEGFGLTIIDEVHHISAEVFSRALFKVVTRNMLGLSATMKRKDGLTKVFKMFLGNIVYTKKRDRCDNVLVKVLHYSHPAEEYNQELFNFRGHVNYTGMIKKLCEFIPRCDFIIHLLSDILTDDKEQQIMILGHNKNLLHYLHDAIVDNSLATVGYYIGGMKEKDLKKSETKKIIIATYQMAAEGLDIKSLNTLLMVTPKTDVCQAVGRILRKKEGSHIILDIVDSHSVFQRQWKKRRAYYKKEKYTIQEIGLNNYLHKEDWVVTFKNGEKFDKRANKSAHNKLLIGKCLID